MSRSLRVQVLGVCAVLLALPLLWAPRAAGQSGGQAAIVVQHGDPTDTGSDCVSFDESKIDGFDLVDRSGFDYRAAAYDFGRALCWLDGEGCKTTDPGGCFCDPVSSWSLWVQGPGDSAPAPSETGAEGEDVTDGTVHYWVWGPFGVPPVQNTSAANVCTEEPASGSPGPTSTPVSDGTSTPSQSPTTEVKVETTPLPATL